MANEPSKDSKLPQNIPLAKIHDLPGIFVAKQPDKAYGGLVTSIQSAGVKEAVILRLREDGEYQLVAGYRRRRASELAGKKDIPAFVYEMSMKEALAYHAKVNTHPDLPIPGKLHLAEPTKDDKLTATPKPAEKQEKPPSPDDKAKATEKPAETVKTAVPAQGDKTEKKTTDGAVISAPSNKDKESPVAPKTGEKQEKPPAPDDKAKAAEKPTETVKAAAPNQSDQAEKKPNDGVAVPTAPAKDKESPVAPKPGEKQEKPAVPGDKSKATEKPTEAVKAAPPDKGTKGKTAENPAAVTGPAAKGPSGTAITQIFDERLTLPGDTERKDIPHPKEGEAFFIVLHPSYLEKSEFNTVSVNQQSEDYKELRKSIELNGVKDPVLARVGAHGTLEILSGQRRHMIAKELNYPVPTIIQKIDDADAKILVADGNLHRPKISTYDLSRTLRMKMEGMKQKSGRRKKGSVPAEELNSDEKLAAEMGMSVSKLNRIIRLSEASKDVCDRVDDGSLHLSIASAISFLSAENQDEVLHLSDLGYKVTNERVERLKKVEKSGKLDEMKMRAILEDKDLAPKQTAAPVPPAPTSTPATVTEPAPSTQPPIPPSPDVKSEPAVPVEAQSAPTASVETPPVPTEPAPPAASAPTAEVLPFPQKEADITKGEQERPEHTKVILTGDRLRKYFPDVTMTPREIEESVYDALEERRQRQIKSQQKEAIFKKNGPTR